MSAPEPIAKLGPFGLYRGYVIIAPDGAIYRGATREDIMHADAKHPVLQVPMEALRHVEDISAIARPVPFQDEPRIDDEGKVRHGPTDGTEVLYATPLAYFTDGKDHSQDGYHEKMFYVVRIDRGVYNPATTRSSVA